MAKFSKTSHETSIDGSVVAEYRGGHQNVSQRRLTATSGLDDTSPQAPPPPLLSTTSMSLREQRIEIIRHEPNFRSACEAAQRSSARSLDAHTQRASNAARYFRYSSSSRGPKWLRTRGKAGSSGSRFSRNDTTSNSCTLGSGLSAARSSSSTAFCTAALAAPWARTSSERKRTRSPNSTWRLTRSAGSRRPMGWMPRASPGGKSGRRRAGEGSGAAFLLPARVWGAEPVCCRPMTPRWKTSSRRGRGAPGPPRPPETERAEVLTSVGPSPRFVLLNT